jgi:cytochrome c biogenesis protein CcmG, thiol:disulfide interchange protein DsbE
VKRLACLLALLLLVTACDRGAQPKFVNRPALDFTVQDSGRRVSLKDLRGKVVVLNFWATWCPPCVEEMPSLVAMQRELKDEDVVVFAVSVDVDEAIYNKFLKDYNVQGLLAVRDPEQVGAGLYGTTGFPETFIIDREGVVLRKLVGPVNWTSPEMLRYLREIAATKGAPAVSATNSR